MKARAEISVLLKDLQTAVAISRSLEPDNIGFPAGVAFGMRRSARRLIFEMALEGDPPVFLSTLNDLLESVQISVGTLERLEAG